MGIGDVLAFTCTLLLALYGCAQLIRRLCLWLTRCPACVRCYRLAVPHSEVAMEPLLECLQAQSVWAENGSGRTLLLLPENENMDALAPLLEQAPAVTALTAEELVVFITKRKEP